MHRHRFLRALVVAFFLSLAAMSPLRAADDYVPGPDSKAQPNVPKGVVTKDVFDESRIFPGTTRDYWVYVPKQIDAS